MTGSRDTRQIDYGDDGSVSVITDCADVPYTVAVASLGGGRTERVWRTGVRRYEAFGG